MRRPLQLDDKLVGITFVDVLFALVIGKILDPFATIKHIPATGLVQLLLAGTITIASWVGYHNSLGRPHYIIRFVNLALLQFLIDVGLVVTYWFTVISAEGTIPSAVRRNSAIPEARYVAISFVLYGVWDLVAARIRRAEIALEQPSEADVPARRSVSQVFAAVAVATWVLLLWPDPHSTAWVVLADAWLIIVIIAYRLAKEWVTPRQARE